MANPENRVVPRWVLGGILAVGITSAIALASLILRAMEKVIAGEGLETYRTFWMVEFNYVGVLVLFGAMLIALLAAAVMWLREFWLIRDLERKYGGKRSDT